ncbi:hypothetical protein ACIO3O_18470 [Streptomyces sp. NPDC087440]|uniref:hypothetical protein n=1 Tax=Streptomyces sp. NPDC087440 TaxID=3365790 RepID=UPI003825DB5C
MDKNAAMNTGAAGRRTAQPLASGALSATRPAADRRNSENRLSAGTENETVTELLAAHTDGDRRSVLGLAWSVSKTKTPEELGAIIAELDAMGHISLAEAVLLGGRERSHGEAMLLALALMGLDLAAYAETVMRAAIPVTVTARTLQAGTA